MVTRKPLPKSANILPHYTTAKDMADSKEPSLTLATNANPIESPKDPDSDADSWERASASASEEEEGLTSHVAQPQPRQTQETDHLAAPGSVDGAAELSHNGEGPSSSPSIVADDWGDKSASDTPDSDPSAAASAPAETNPFRRKISQSSGQHSVTVPRKSTETLSMPPTEDLDKLSLSDAPTNPWDALGQQQHPIMPVMISDVADQEPAQDIWGSRQPSRVPSTAPLLTDAQPDQSVPLVESIQPVGHDAWDDSTPKDSSIIVPAAFSKGLEDEKLDEDNHAWDDVAAQDKGKAPMVLPERTGSSAGDARDGEWNLIDDEPIPGPSRVAEPSQPLEAIDEKGPALPPRSSEKAPMASPRTPISAKAETYQVKNISWRDVNEAEKPRNTPILIQNANGPCPLMALVNALTLTTPPDAEEAVLVNTLRTREQISLDLLLNAVFDELMSERRMTGDVSLPDMTELYDFLMGLHTGMNVNPRFVPTEEMEKAFNRTSLTHLHPHERGDLIPGTFEETQEMAFYRTFQIPLIHGWLPRKSDAVYDILKRQAESYEDAQNLLFREEELEDKLSNPNGAGLTEEEQSLYHDILNIKSFLHTSATQLTTWGLEVITKAMRPGSVAILFRNDHFSTLYRHPQTHEIYGLVTDAGYAGHQEIVWESLVDVNGERSEFFSGDFRIVGGSAPNDNRAASGSASDDQRGWTQVQSSKRDKKIPHDETPLSPSEQEDRDLALAMQLQEEEDHRHNTEQAQRRRESQLSEQFIEQQATRRNTVGQRQGSSSTTSGQQPGGTPATRRPASAAANTPTQSSPLLNPARGGRPSGPQLVRSLVPPVLRSQGVSRSNTANGDDDAPPSYEDAARDRPYVPPAGHPSHPNSSPNASVVSMARLPPSRAPGVAGGQMPPRAGPSAMRRGGSTLRQGVSPATAGGGSSREKDCVVM